MGLLLGAAHGVLLARRFTNRSCHALSSRPKVRMPCPITTLHSDPATEHACNTVEPALAVVQGRARGEHARRLGALGRAGIRAASIQRLLLVQSGRSWCCSSRAWARCLRPQLTAVVNYLLSVKGDRHCQADWHEGITPSFPRSPPPGPHHFQCPEPNLPPCAAVGIVLPLARMSLCPREPLPVFLAPELPTPPTPTPRRRRQFRRRRRRRRRRPHHHRPRPRHPTAVESRHCRRHRRRRRRSHYHHRRRRRSRCPSTSTRCRPAISIRERCNLACFEALRREHTVYLDRAARCARCARSVPVLSIPMALLFLSLFSPFI